MSQADRPPTDPQTPRLLPGMAACGLWMFFLCLLGLLGVSTHKLPHVVLLLCIAFAAGGQGLLALRRWGWALTMATVLLSAMYGLWGLVHFHQLPLIFMLVVNLILFLYLARPEVRERLH